MLTLPRAVHFNVVVANTRVEIVLACQQIMGTYGWMDEYHMERRVHYVILLSIVGRSPGIQRNKITAQQGLPTGKEFDLWIS